MSFPPSAEAGAPLEGLRLRRALSFWDLIIYGVIVISPMAPMTFFGILSQRGHGHAATAILFAMFAMMLTAISYGRMARAHPSAGSVFTYVGKEISPAVGYLIGWSMVLDYMVNPMINVIFCSQQLHVIFPASRYWLWAIVFSVMFTALNIQGIKASARLNVLLAAGMGLVVAIFFVAAGYYVAHQPHAGAGFFTQPLYDPARWQWSGLLSGTALAVLAYMGFDSISTLSEEAKNPRNVLPATVLTCVVIGLLSASEVYLAQLVWPITQPFPDLDTAFTSVAARAWSPLGSVVAGTLILACIASGTGMQLGAARLLYGMGRCGALPKGFCGALESKKQIPRNNVVLVGAVSLGGAILLPAIAGESTGFDLGASLLNFGALIGFMGVNASAFMRFYWRADLRRTINLLLPVLGFLVCLILWWNLSSQARILGGVWMAIGLGLGLWRLGGFRMNLDGFEGAETVAERSEKIPGLKPGEVS
jgi:amino acid transporter